MEQDAVSDPDGEIIGRIASAILRDEQEIPRSVERRRRECWTRRRAQSEQKQPEILRVTTPPRLAFFHCIVLATAARTPSQIESPRGARDARRENHGSPAPPTFTSAARWTEVA